MDRRVSLDPEDIRDAKLKVLRQVAKVVPSVDVVAGQYVADAANPEKRPGYKENASVPPDSRTPTYAMVVLNVRNERWDGVPFILKAGKALDERRSEIRVQLKSTPGDIFAEDDGLSRGRRGAEPADLGAGPNEFVLRIQPHEEMYMKLTIKEPGLGVRPVPSEMELSSRWREEQERKEVAGEAPRRAYERLILDAVNGHQAHFVRGDELEAAWAIVDPINAAIESGEVPVHEYTRGTRGPKEADALRKAWGTSRARCLARRAALRARTVVAEAPVGNERAETGARRRGSRCARAAPTTRRRRTTGPEARAAAVGCARERGMGEGGGGNDDSDAAGGVSESVASEIDDHAHAPRLRFFRSSFVRSASSRTRAPLLSYRTSRSCLRRVDQSLDARDVGDVCLGATRGPRAVRARRRARERFRRRSARSARMAARRGGGRRHVGVGDGKKAAEVAAFLMPSPSISGKYVDHPGHGHPPALGEDGAAEEGGHADQGTQEAPVARGEVQARALPRAGAVEVAGCNIRASC